MNRRATTLLCIVAVVCAVVVFRTSTPLTDLQKAAAPSTSSTGRVSAVTTATSVVSLPQLANPNPLANLMPDVFATPEQKLRKLQGLGDPFAAQLQAVRSGDPLLVAQAVYMTFHCADMPVQLQGKSVRQWMTENSFDPKTGKKIPPNENLIAFHEAWQTATPVKTVPPPDIAAEIKNQSENWPDPDTVDYARQTELLRKLSATLTPAQRASFNAMIERSASECRGRLIGKDFGAEYRAALERLVANGVVSAQLFNQRTGWKSEGLGKH